jgi:hypothetical protein
MDRIEFRREEASFATAAQAQIVPYVNGTSLLSLPVQRKRTKAGPNRRARLEPLGDGHAGLAVPAPELAELRAPDVPREAPVLGCSCGVTECSPLIALIAADDKAVTWSVGGHVFRFGRAEYERALRAAVQLAAD